MIVKTQSDSADQEVLFDLWKLPSPSTLIFLIVCGFTLFIFYPKEHFVFFIDVFRWAFFAFFLCVPTRLFLSEPQKMIDKYDMKSIKDFAPEICEKAKYWSKQLGIKTIPQILYTNENIVIQAFGTFTQYYIVFNYDQLVRIINKDKINQSDNPKTLDTILIHELGHIRSGDVWKLGLSEKILKIILIYSILQLLLIFGNKYNLSSLLLLSPPERALFIFGWVGFVAFILLSIYILCTIGNLREYFADEIGVSQLSNYGSGFLNAALDVSIDQNEFNSLSVTSPRFLGNADTTRRSIVLKSGKYPREKIKQLVLIGGLSIGMAGFFGEDGLEILTCGIILGGLFMCFLYLLPGFSGNNRVTNYSPWQVIKIVCIFWIGITFMLLFKTLLVQLILWLNNVYPTIHVQFLLSDLQIIGLVTIYALLLVIALYGSIMIFQLFIDKFFKRSPQKIRLTYITFLSIVFGSLIFIVLDMGFKLMISLIT